MTASHFALACRGVSVPRRAVSFIRMNGADCAHGIALEDVVRDVPPEEVQLHIALYVWL